MIASHCPPLLRAGYGLRAIARTCSQGKDSSRSTSRGNVASCATHSFGSASTWCGARTAARNGSIVRGRNACTAAWARLGDRREPLCSRSVGHPTTSTSTSPSLPTPRSQVSWMPSKPIRHAGSTRRSRGSSCLRGRRDTRRSRFAGAVSASSSDTSDTRRPIMAPPVRAGWTETSLRHPCGSMLPSRASLSLFPAA